MKQIDARQTGAVPGSQQPELSRVSQLTAQVVGSFVHDPLSVVTELTLG